MGFESKSLIICYFKEIFNYKNLNKGKQYENN